MGVTKHWPKVTRIHWTPSVQLSVGTTVKPEVIKIWKKHRTNTCRVIHQRKVSHPSARSYTDHRSLRGRSVCSICVAFNYSDKMSFFLFFFFSFCFYPVLSYIDYLYYPLLTPSLHSPTFLCLDQSKSSIAYAVDNLNWWWWKFTTTLF